MAIATPDNPVAELGPASPLEFAWGDGSAVIAANALCIIGPIPFACRITKASIFSDLSCTATIDIWKNTTANYPPTVADTIVASAKPTLTGALEHDDSTLTGWTKTIAAGDWLIGHVDSNNNAKFLGVTLTVVNT